MSELRTIERNRLRESARKISGELSGQTPGADSAAQRFAASLFTGREIPPRLRPPVASPSAASLCSELLEGFAPAEADAASPIPSAAATGSSADLFAEALWEFAWRAHRESPRSRTTIGRLLAQRVPAQTAAPLRCDDDADVIAERCRLLAYDLARPTLVEECAREWMLGLDAAVYSLLSESADLDAAVRASMSNFLEQRAAYGLLAAVTRLSSRIRRLARCLEPDAHDMERAALSLVAPILERPRVTEILRERLRLADVTGGYRYLHRCAERWLRKAVAKKVERMRFERIDDRDGETRGPVVAAARPILVSPIWALVDAPAQQMSYLATRNCLTAQHSPIEFSELVARRRHLTEGNGHPGTPEQSAYDFLGRWRRGVAMGSALPAVTSELERVWLPIRFRVDSGAVAWLCGFVDDELLAGCSAEAVELTTPGEFDPELARTVALWRGTLHDYSDAGLAVVLALSRLARSYRRRLGNNALGRSYPSIQRWTREANNIDANASRVQRIIESHLTDSID